MKNVNQSQNININLQMEKYVIKMLPNAQEKKYLIIYATMVLLAQMIQIQMITIMMEYANVLIIIIIIPILKNLSV